MIELFYAVLMVVISLLYLSWILIFLSPGSRRNKNHDYAPISVVIPAYNEEKNIRATIESILKADYPNKKEIIVVNDGSRDKTPEIVKEMMKKHREIKLIKTDRIGKGRAVNAGVKKSRNDLFAILDADTEIEKIAQSAELVPAAGLRPFVVVAPCRRQGGRLVHSSRILRIQEVSL